MEKTVNKKKETREAILKQLQQQREKEQQLRQLEEQEQQRSVYE